MDLTVIDIVFLIILIGSAIRGVVKGFIAEVFSIGAAIAGLICAFLFAGVGAEIVESIAGKVFWSQLASFLLIFLLVYLIVKFIENLLHDFFDRFNLEKLDKVLGFLVGFVEGLLFVSLIILIVFWFSSLEAFKTWRVLDESVVARFLLPIIQPMAESLIKQYT